MKDTVGQGTMSKAGFVPFALSLVIESREKFKLAEQSQKQTVSGVGAWRMESEEETFRKGPESRGNWTRLWKACGRAVGGRDSYEGEKVVPSKEPEFSSGEAVEASRGVHVDPFLFQRTCTSVLFRNVGPPRPVIFTRCLPGLLSV